MSRNGRRAGRRRKNHLTYACDDIGQVIRRSRPARLPNTPNNLSILDSLTLKLQAFL